MAAAKKLNPYDELGVERDATAEDVRAAFRRRAKEAHPDRGGDVDGFQRAKLSEMILLDPARRAKFDATGAVDEEGPDNARATALQIVQAFIDGAIQAYVASNFSPPTDPRRRSLVQDFRDFACGQIGQAEAAMMAGRKHVLFLQDMRKRFRSDAGEAGPIERSFDCRIESAKGQLEQLRKSQECHRLAIEIFEKYSFEADAPGFATWPT